PPPAHATSVDTTRTPTTSRTATSRPGGREAPPAAVGAPAPAPCPAAPRAALRAAAPARSPRPRHRRRPGGPAPARPRDHTLRARARAHPHAERDAERDAHAERGAVGRAHADAARHRVRRARDAPGDVRLQPELLAAVVVVPRGRDGGARGSRRGGCRVPL